MIGLYLFHCFLFSTIVVWMLMQRDGNRVPLRMKLLTLFIAVVSPLAFQQLAVVPASLPFATQTGGLIAAIAFVAGGCAVGTLCGSIIPIFAGAGSTASPIMRNDLIWLFAVAGACLGWQAMVTAAIAIVVFDRFVSWAQSKPHRTSASAIAAILFLQHLTWRLQWIGW